MKPQKSIPNSTLNFVSLFSEAEKKYHDYLANSKKYYFARGLWDANAELYTFAKQIRDTLSPEEMFHVDMLIAHLESWREQWLKLESELSPVSDSVFSFISEVPFPQQSKTYLYNIKLNGFRF